MAWIIIRVAALITTLMSSASAQEGFASRYGRESGSQVACGGSLNENALTAAHRSLPCGSERWLRHCGFAELEDWRPGGMESARQAPRCRVFQQGRRTDLGFSETQVGTLAEAGGSHAGLPLPPSAILDRFGATTAQGRQHGPGQ